MRIKCPMCGEELNVPDGIVEGQHVCCSSCKTKFSYSERMKKGDAGETSAYLIIKCKECGQKIVIRDGIQEGQHVRCPFCDKKFSYSAEVEKEKEEKHDKLVKCALCGEIIVVDESIEIGQHILCPYCDKNTAVLQTKKGTMTSLPKVIGKCVNIANYMLEMPSDCGARDCPHKTIK